MLPQKLLGSGESDCSRRLNFQVELRKVSNRFLSDQKYFSDFHIIFREKLTINQTTHKKFLLVLTYLNQ